MFLARRSHHRCTKIRGNTQTYKQCNVFLQGNKNITKVCWTTSKQTQPKKTTSYPVSKKPTNTNSQKRLRDHANTIKKQTRPHETSTAFNAHYEVCKWTGFKRTSHQCNIRNSLVFDNCNSREHSHSPTMHLERRRHSSKHLREHECS